MKKISGEAPGTGLQYFHFPRRGAAAAGARMAGVRTAHKHYFPRRRVVGMLTVLSRLRSRGHRKIDDAISPRRIT